MRMIYAIPIVVVCSLLLVFFGFQLGSIYESSQYEQAIILQKHTQEALDIAASECHKKDVIIEQMYVAFQKEIKDSDAAIRLYKQMIEIDRIGKR